MTLLSIRVPLELAQRLAQRKENNFLNISAFCRRAIERELDRPVLDAEPEPTIARRSASPAVPVLIAPQKVGA